MAEKQSKVVSLRDEAPPPVPRFTFSALDTDEPEVDLLALNRSVAAAKGQVVPGMDLSGVPRILLLAGRGKTGKTTGVRWMAERAIAAGRPVQMGDLDPTNASFASYFEGVHRPTGDDPAAALKWLERFISFSLAHKLTTVVDLGGGDTTLRRLADELPNLPGMVEEQGAALVLLYHVGPQADDLAPLVALEGRGFQPAATAIVMNEAAVEPGLSREEAFARIHKHSAFRAALARGVVPVWMPRLMVADAIEARRASFGAAQDGRAGLGPFDRARVAKWLAAMEEQYAGVQSWLP